MSFKNKKTRRDFLIASGAAILGASGVASAAQSAFGFKKMEAGYEQVAMEGKCGGKMKDKEGHCGGMKDKEGHCGGKMKGKKEGKCGEGKCGGKMKGKEGKK